MYKKAALFTVLGSVMALNAGFAQAQNITNEAVIEIFAGVMNGIVHEDHLDYLLGCMNGTEALITDVENAIADFSQGDFWSISEGILEIQQFISDIPPTAHNCGSIPSDFGKVAEFFAIFNNATLLSERVSYNLIWYYSDIMTHLTLAVTYWNQEDYFNFGDNIGDALVLACGDHSSTIPTPAVVSLGAIQTALSYQH